MATIEQMEKAILLADSEDRQEGQAGDGRRRHGGCYAGARVGEI